MAREEQPREDLLREAVALVERAELKPDDGSPSIVMGFRAGGEISFFIGEDPVYQFNRLQQLRRAFVGGRPIKAVAGQLVALERQRDKGQTALIARPLLPSEQQQLLDDVQRQLAELGQTLASGQFQLVGQVPAEANVVRRTIDWLTQHGQALTVAETPNVH
jgi:hypothetical protein